MHFVITAHDGKDGEALNRRMAARPAHIEYIEKGIAAGTHLAGGALLDDEGTMVGSVVIVDYPSIEDVKTKCLANDPYVTGNVWQEIDVKPFRMSEVFLTK